MLAFRLNVYIFFMFPHHKAFYFQVVHPCLSITFLWTQYPINALRKSYYIQQTRHLRKSENDVLPFPSRVSVTPVEHIMKSRGDVNVTQGAVA